MKRDKKIASFGKIYLQVMFSESDKALERPPINFDYDQYLKAEQERLKSVVAGKLYVNVVHAKGLAVGDKSDDTSDPFCKVTMPNGKTFTSPIIEKELNPLWNFKVEANVNLPAKVYFPQEVI